MTKMYSSSDVNKVVNAVRGYYEGKQTKTHDQEKDPDTIEVHNYLPQDYEVSGENIAPRGERGRDDEEEEDGVVARYPASYHAAIEGDQLIIRSKAPQQQQESDRFTFDRSTRDRRDGPPRTLAQMNQFFRDYYPRRRSTAAR